MPSYEQAAARYPWIVAGLKRIANERTKPMTGTREDIEPIIQFFRYEHLPEHLQAISAPFSLLAISLIDALPRNPERTVALRKLLEAKDAAVRAKLFK
jgi:hypothetical protein